MRLVVLGLSLSSSWGNGHATTYRALLRAFAARGHDILFLERDVPWYAQHRDLVAAEYCRLEFYDDLRDLARFRAEVARADAVMVGSYVPEGAAVGRWVQETARGVTAFYDIDTPVTLAKLARGEHDYLTPDLIPGYDLYLSFTGGPTLLRLEQQYGAPAARPLYCCVDPQAYPLRKRKRRWDLSYLGTYSADRQPALERLLIEPARRAPQLRFVVAGPQYPADVAWPDNVERIAHVPPREHPDFYAASRFTLNLIRADMIRAGYSPSVRLFEASACGTPIISEPWEGIETLFAPGREIVLAEDGREVLNALLDLPETDRRRLAAGARRRVLEKHTAAHRAAALERHLAEAGDRRHGSAEPRQGGDGTSLRGDGLGGARPLDRAASGPADGSEPAPSCSILRRRNPMKNGTGKLVLVAGGAGFLGSHLCDALLDEGCQVIAVDSLLTGRKQNLRHLEREPRFDFIEADITDPLPARLKAGRAKLDRIFNLACAASPPHYQANPEHTMLTSVVGTHHLLGLAERTGARFLLASTSEIYGDPEVHPQNETYWGNVNPTGPRACYDEGKRAAETLTFDFERAGRVETRVARIFNTYGPRMRADDGRVVSNVICQALAGDDITLYGDGSQTRSFCYVSDLVDGLMRLMDHDGALPGAVNLGNPNEMRVSDLVARVLALTGSRSVVSKRPLPVDDPRRRRPDIERAAKLLGWSPRTSLETGLKATIGWFAAEADRTAAVPVMRGRATLNGAVSV